MLELDLFISLFQIHYNNVLDSYWLFILTHAIQGGPLGTASIDYEKFGRIIRNILYTLYIVTIFGLLDKFFGIF